MAEVQAPYSRYKRNNLLIWIAILVGLACWFAYDGYKNQDFIEKHTNEDGQPDATLVFNQKAPYGMIALAVLLGIYFAVVKNKKAVADDHALRVGKLAIPYDRIESINKTYFDKKGYFTLRYKDDQQQEKELKLSDRTYDNLPALLDTLISKISE